MQLLESAAIISPAVSEAARQYADSADSDRSCWAKMPQNTMRSMVQQFAIDVELESTSDRRLV